MVKGYDKFDAQTAGKMHRRHYSHNDYLEKGKTVQGIVFGELSTELGLENGRKITDQEFRALAANKHALTGEELTRGRKASEKRAGRKPFCDMTVSMPKTFSCQGILGDDERIKEYHKSGVEKVKLELERIVGCQANKRTGLEHLERTGNLSGVQYCHDSNRALEPQIHDHLIMWNVTKSPANGKRYTIEFGEFMNQSPYITKVYWDEIARVAMAAGFNIVQDQYGAPQISELIELAKKHQVRSDELEVLVEHVEEYVGTKLSDNEFGIIVRASRGLDLDEFKRKWDDRKTELDGFKDLDPDSAEVKRRGLLQAFSEIVRSCCESNLYKTSTDEVRAEQQAKVTAEERELMEGLKIKRSAEPLKVESSLEVSITFAIEHVFQQKSVCKVYELYETILQHAQGQGVNLVEMRERVGADRRVILGKHNEICSSEHYRKELEGQLMIRDGKGKGVPLQYNADFTSQNLSDAQRKTVDSLLESKHQFTALSGSSGVGKTERILSEVIKANVAAGHQVSVVAPSDAARDVLQQESQKVGYSAARSVLAAAVSLQMWQADPRLHESLGKGDLLIIDEASFTSLKQGHLEIERARKAGYRVMLSGDLDQGRSIEAGDFFRLAIGAGVHTAELHEIRRQSETALDGHFRKAIQFFKKGATTRGFQELLAAGCIHEVKGHARIEAMADAILKAEADGVQAMCANFTHRENDAIAECVRKKMNLGSENMLNVYSTLGWSDAQKKGISKLRPDMVVEITRGKDKGKAYRIIPHESGRAAPKGSVYARPLHGVGPVITLTAANSRMFDVCEQRSIRVSVGEKLFARSAHKKGHLINGEEITVGGWDDRGNPIDANGRSVEHRNLCYAYASTSRKVQGSAATRVITGFDRQSVKAATKEVPYVINGRGREDCQIFVESILDLAQLQNRSAERKLSTEMPVQILPPDLQKLRDRTEPKTPSMTLSRGDDDDGGRCHQPDYDYDQEQSVGYDMT